MRGLTYSNHDYCGAAHAVLTNNTLIKSVASYGSYHPNNQIRVLNRARLTLVDGGEIRTPVTNAINGGTTSGGVILLPDEEGYTSLIIDEGGIASWWCCNGSNKAVVEVANGFVEYNRTSWWGWHNRERILWAIKSVNIPQGKQMICRGIPTKYSTNDDTLGTTNFNPPFSGDGDLLIANTRKGNTFEPTIYRGDNTCTGRVVVAPDDDTAVARLHFANGANWAGTVVLDGRTDLTPQDSNYAASGKNPTTVSFAGVELNASYSIRIWITEAASGGYSITNDIINVGSLGWTVKNGATLNFAPQTSISHNLLPAGTEIVIGRMPKGGTIPPIHNHIVPFALHEQPIEGNEEESNLVAVVLDTSAATFIGNGVTDLNNPDGWIGSQVPLGSAVVIKGTEAVVNANQPLPEFASIQLQNGSTLRVVGLNTSSESILLPPLIIDATSTLIIGDDTGTATAVELPVAFESCQASHGEQLGKLIIQSGATLNVQPDTRFSNIAIEHYGTLQKLGTAGLGIILGHALADATTYFAYTGVNGTFEVHSTDNRDNGRIWFASPDSGGRVKVRGDILLQNMSFPTAYSLDTKQLYFGYQNKTDEPFNVILDNTQILSMGPFLVGGRANVILRHGSSIQKDRSILIARSIENYIQDLGTVTICDTSYIDHAGKGNYVINATGPDGGVTVKDGGLFGAPYIKGDKKGTFRSENGIAGVSKRTDYQRTKLLEGFAKVVIPEGKYLSIESTLLGAGYNFEAIRSVTLSDIPITGGGDLIISNAVPAEGLCVGMVSKNNTCTGEVYVAPLSPEAKYTRLLFYNGANWAGTVRSTGYMIITNVSGKVNTPATVTFNRLHLQEGPLVLHAFRDASTGVRTIDNVNITESMIRHSTDSGYLQLEGEPFELNETAVLGTAPAGAWRDIDVRDCANNRLKVKESAPNEASGLVMVSIERSPFATLIFIR